MRAKRKHPIGQDLGRLIILYAEFACQLFLVAAGLWPAIWLVQTLSVFADASWKWLLLILGATLTFVYGYFLALLGVRLVTPYPIEGYFSRGVGGKPPRAMIVYMLNAYLSKARYFPPWTEMFGLAIVNTFPLSQLYRHFFGPHRKGILTGGLVYMPDPYLVYAGRNVVLGGGALISCHVYDQRGLFVKRVVIEDDVTIGGVFDNRPRREDPQGSNDRSALGRGAQHPSRTVRVLGWGSRPVHKEDQASGRGSNPDWRIHRRLQPRCAIGPAVHERQPLGPHATAPTADAMGLDPQRHRPGPPGEIPNPSLHPAVMSRDEIPLPCN